MPTSGGYIPPTVPPAPECSYLPPMTRAAALALRTAGSLSPNCVVVVTDGPTIGTAGHTSPTQVELNPVSATEFGQTARIHTNFDNTAWTGFYDIDLGTAGSIVFMADPWNNRVSDPDADAPTVHTQFPWHAVGNRLRDNLVNDAVLPGWGPAIDAGGTITDNEIRNSTVDLTGRTGATSAFDRNRLSNSTVTLNTPTSFFAQNNVDQGTVTHAGTTAGSFSFQNNTMLTGTFTADAATTAQVTADNNVFGGTSGGYRVQVVGKTSNPAIISGNRLFSQSASTYELQVGGSGNVTVTSNEIGAGTVTLNGPATATVTGCTLSGVTATTGPGALALSGLNSGSTTVTHAGTGTLTVSNSTVTGTTVTTGASSTRGLTLDQTTTRSSTVTQNGTGSANTDAFNGGTILHKATVTVSTTSAASVSGTYAGVVIDSGGVLNVNNTTDANPGINAHINNGATVNLSGAGTLIRTRADCEAVLNTAFPATSCIVEGRFTVTTTAANTGRLANAAYSDWV